MPKFEVCERLEFHEPIIHGENIVILGGWNISIINLVDRKIKIRKNMGVLFEQ